MVIDVLKTYGGDCTCGKTHSLETEIMVVECDALKKANEYIDAYGIKGFTVAVYDENTYKATADRHPKVDAEVILSPDNLHILISFFFYVCLFSSIRRFHFLLIQQF